MDIGLAAWSNRHFDHILYPLGTLHAEWLPRYSSVFSVVEADILHHHVLEPEQAQAWIDGTSEGFRFLPKLHADATHPGMAETPGAGRQKTAPSYDEAALAAAAHAIAATAPLRDAGRLGPTLAEFPRVFAPTAAHRDWLAELLCLAPPEGMAVEFRDPAWFDEETRGLLAQHGAALCWGTYEGAVAPDWDTAPFRYLRFVGKTHKRRDRWVTQKDRLDAVLEMRARALPEDRPTFAIVTNRFEGNAIDSLPRIAAALGETALARRCTRRPAQPLFP